MKSFNLLKIIILLVLLFGSMSAFSQTQADTKISEAELRDFAKVYMVYQITRDEFSDNIVKAIEDSGLKPEDYQKMRMAEAEGREPDASKEDLAKMKKLDKKIKKISKDLDDRAYGGTSLNREKYKVISNAVEQDRILQVRVHRIVIDLMDKL